MNLKTLALVGLGVYALSRVVSATPSPSASSPSQIGSTTTSQLGSTTTKGNVVISAEALPAGFLPPGVQGIKKSLIPQQLRMNALKALDEEYDRLMEPANRIFRTYSSMETRLAAQRVSGLEESYAPAMAYYKELEAKYIALSTPISQWRAAEKAKILAMYPVR